MANYTPQQIEEFLEHFFDVVGTRQYVGARYVPLFGRKGESSIEWDDSAPYEPLTVVLYQGNSYTSRQYVPTGVPITNQAYWANTGNYNSQVEAYRQEVVRVSNAIGDVEQDMADLLEHSDEEDAKIRSLLPATAFSESETVRDYVDRVVNGVAELLPAARFSPTSTVYNFVYTVLQQYAAPIPTDPYPRYGTEGQVLRTNGDGTTQWANPNLPSESAMAQAIADWLDAHPEATTTILDGSVTTPKIADGAVTESKLSSPLRDELLNETVYVTHTAPALSGVTLTNTHVICSRPYHPGDHISAVMFDTARTGQLNVTMTYWRITGTGNIQITTSRDFTVQIEDGVANVPFDYYPDGDGYMGFLFYVDDGCTLSTASAASEKAKVVPVGTITTDANFAGYGPNMRVVRYENADEVIYELRDRRATAYDGLSKTLDPIASDGTTQCILKQVFTAGTRITGIVFPTKLSSELTISISTWVIVDGVATRRTLDTYTVTPRANVVSIPLDRTLTEDTYVGYTLVTGNSVWVQMDVNSVTPYGMWLLPLDATSGSPSSLTFTTLMKVLVDDSLEHRIAAIPLDDSLINSSQGVYHVGPGLTYTQIQQVLDTATEDGITIILHPSDTPYTRFSTMRQLNESYPWSGLARVRNISIIGMDKARCVVRDDSGQYDTPPAEIACNGMVKNVTFVSTHDDGTFVSGPPSYAVHVDNRPADIAGMRLTFEDCIFVSYQCSPLGIGIYRNQTVKFRNCEFHNRTPQDFAPYADYPTDYNMLGAIIVHTTMGYAGGNMSMVCENNIMITDNNRYAICIRDGDDVPECVFAFVGNTIFNVAQNNSEVKWEGAGLVGTVQAPYNRLNSATDLNRVS